MMTEAYVTDASFTLAGCDKTIPGALMPIFRNNLIGITLYGGSILPGRSKIKISILSLFLKRLENFFRKINEKEFDEIEKACPGCGACGGMYTANTMAAAIEAMGMSLPGSAAHPAVDYKNNISQEKQDIIDSVKALFNLIKIIFIHVILSQKIF